MPIYSYKCRDCGEKFDILTGVGAGKEELKCRKCGSRNIDKLPAAFNSGSGTNRSSSCPTGTCNLG